MTIKETIPAEERRSSQEQREYLGSKLRECVRFAYENAPGMKDWFDKAGVRPSEISTIDDLKKLPVLRADYIADLQKDKPPFGGLLTVPLGKLKRIHIGPGPTFEPSARAVSMTINLWERIGFREGDVVVNTQSYHMFRGGLAFDEGLTSIGCCVIPWGPGNTDLLMEVMHQLPVTGIIGSASYIMDIINRAEAKGYDIHKDFHLRKAVAGMEAGGGPIRKTLREKYGITPCLDFYATSIAGTIAAECSERNGMHILPDVIVELLDPETGKEVAPGEVGEVVVTQFDETYPLIRIGTGDLSAFNYEPCPCGRTLPRLTRILGRSGDSVRTRGLFIHPRDVEPALAPFSEVSRYQAVVTRPGTKDVITINVELKSEEGVDKEELAERLKKAFTGATKCRVDKVEYVAKDTIPEKHRLVIDGRGEWT